MNCKDIDLYELLGVLSTANIQEVCEWHSLYGKVAGLDNSNLELTYKIEILTAVFVRIMVFGDMTPSS